MTDISACGGVIFHFPRWADCAIVDKAFLFQFWLPVLTKQSRQITWKDWIDLLTANNPLREKEHCIFHSRYHLQLSLDKLRSYVVLCNYCRYILPPGRMLHIQRIHTYSGYDQAAEFSPQYYGMRSSPMKTMAHQFAPVPLRWDPRPSSISWRW